VGEYKPDRTRSILWHAGASSVSIAGIQLSLTAHLHACRLKESEIQRPKVFATARNNEKCNMCVKELGCDGAVNTTESPNWAAEIKGLNGGKGIDLVFDFVGAPYFQSNLEVLAQDGCIVNLGLLGGGMIPGPVDISPFVMKRVRFEGSTLRTRTLDYQIRLRDLFVEIVLPGLIEGRFVHLVDRVLKWDDVAKGHEMLEQNETKGKIVCTTASRPFEAAYDDGVQP
jgi:NADPH:quinone reductase-like Zn-dependent oxidoreductase